MRWGNAKIVDQKDISASRAYALLVHGAEGRTERNIGARKAIHFRHEPNKKRARTR